MILAMVLVEAPDLPHGKLGYGTGSNVRGAT